MTYGVAGGLRALPPWSHEPIRSFVFQTGMGDGEAQATGTGRICEKTNAKYRWSLGVPVSSKGDIKKCPVFGKALDLKPLKLCDSCSFQLL